MIAAPSATTLTDNSPSASAVTTETNPPTRFEHLVHHVAAELRAFAERHPGKRIGHFEALHRSVFITCRPHGATRAWELRVARYGALRPEPFSLAEYAWTRDLQLWRNQFAVPPGATMQYDPALDGLDPRGYAMLIRWTETDANAFVPMTQPELI